jgi:hypothetical protein
MLHVFAIDPAVCTDMNWSRYCLEHCKPSSGRAIADLPPGCWTQKSLDKIMDLSLGPVKIKSLKRRLEKAKYYLVYRPHTSWDFGNEEWGTQAILEHKREPFSAIVSPEDNNDYILHPDNVDESNPMWDTPTGKRITRSSGVLVKTIMPSLVVAEEIHFIDRGFNVDDNSLYTKNYTEIINRLAEKVETFPNMVIHCCPISQDPVNQFESELKRLYRPIIPSGSQLTVLIYKIGASFDSRRGKHPFHNRFIVTDKQCIMIGYGTDSSNADSDAPEDIECRDQKVFEEILDCCRNENHIGVELCQNGKIVINGDNDSL